MHHQLIHYWSMTIGREEHAFSQKKNQEEGDEVQLAEGIHGVEQAFS